jgi:hypothetical protein
MLNFALLIHVNSHIDSAVASTREFWRRKLGFPEEIVADPRPLAEIATSLVADPRTPEGGWRRWRQSD